MTPGHLSFSHKSDSDAELREGHTLLRLPLRLRLLRVRLVHRCINSCGLALRASSASRGLRFARIFALVGEVEGGVWRPAFGVWGFGGVDDWGGNTSAQGRGVATERV